MKREVFVPILLIVIAVTVYITFFYQPVCDNAVCWETKLSECSRAQYIHNPIDVTWEYKINGEIEGRCEVEVTALQIKRGLKRTEVLEGHTMTCFLPLGATTPPEGNPNLCTGRLKEEMQNLIIIKLHEYVVQNIGQITEELTKIEGVTSPIVETNSTG